MADVNKLVFSIVKFLKDQTTQESLSEDAIESLEGKYDIDFDVSLRCVLLECCYLIHLLVYRLQY